jgi:hypothetical protein
MKALIVTDAARSVVLKQTLVGVLTRMESSVPAELALRLVAASKAAIDCVAKKLFTR